MRSSCANLGEEISSFGSSCSEFFPVMSSRNKLLAGSRTLKPSYNRRGQSFDAAGRLWRLTEGIQTFESTNRTL